MDYTTIPSQDTIDKVTKALGARSVKVHIAKDKAEALEIVKNLIPAGSDIMTGASQTLEEIGFIDYLKSGAHPWKNLKDAILAETDKTKQAELRKQSVFAKYWLGSVHAITEDGEVLDASASGSQIPAYSFTSDNVIWVAGAQKIVADMNSALKRIGEHVVPLEDARMKSVGFPGTKWNYTFTYRGNMMPNRTIHMVLVQEKLGF